MSSGRPLVRRLARASSDGSAPGIRFPPETHEKLIDMDRSLEAMPPCIQTTMISSDWRGCKRWGYRGCGRCQRLRDEENAAPHDWMMPPQGIALPGAGRRRRRAMPARMEIPVGPDRSRPCYRSFGPATGASRRSMRSSETACRGRVIRSFSAPPSIRSHSGESSSASRDDRSSSAYWSGVGRWGEPIRFHASNALPWCRSTR